MPRGLPVYETHYRPLLWLAGVGELMVGDERVGMAAVAEEEDTPVSRLGVLVAPALVLTWDARLVDAGIGVNAWAGAVVGDLVEDRSDVAATKRVVQQSHGYTSP